jgi:hypothetical protein
MQFNFIVPTSHRAADHLFCLLSLLCLSSLQTPTSPLFFKGQLTFFLQVIQRLNSLWLFLAGQDYFRDYHISEIKLWLLWGLGGVAEGQDRRVCVCPLSQKQQWTGPHRKLCYLILSWKEAGAMEVAERAA